MEVVNKSIKCICGGKFTASNKNRHYKCKKHLAFHICGCGLSFTDKSASRHIKMQQHIKYINNK